MESCVKMATSKSFDSSMTIANACTPFIGSKIGISNSSSRSSSVFEKNSNSCLPDISQFLNLCMTEEDQTAHSSSDKIYTQEDVENRPSNNRINNIHSNGEW